MSAVPSWRSQSVDGGHIAFQPYATSFIPSFVPAPPDILGPGFRNPDLKTSMASGMKVLSQRPMSTKAKAASACAAAHTLPRQKSSLLRNTVRDKLLPTQKMTLVNSRTRNSHGWATIDSKQSVPCSSEEGWRGLTPWEDSRHNLEQDEGDYRQNAGEDHDVDLGG